MKSIKALDLSALVKEHWGRLLGKHEHGYVVSLHKQTS